MSNIFEKIINKEIPAQIVYEDDLCLCFKDIEPQAPLHLLMIPKKVIPSLNEIKEEDKALLGHLMLKIAEVAKQEKIDEKGYRVVTNINEYGGQLVKHLHFHILGKRPLNWPPG